MFFVVSSERNCKVKTWKGSVLFAHSHCTILSNYKCDNECRIDRRRRFSSFGVTGQSLQVGIKKKRRMRRLGKTVAMICVGLNLRNGQ